LCEVVIAPFAQETLTFVSQNGQVILLSMDQMELGNRMAVLDYAARWRLNRLFLISKVAAFNWKAINSNTQIA